MLSVIEYPNVAVSFLGCDESLCVYMYPSVVVYAESRASPGTDVSQIRRPNSKPRH